jgi:hypothetical protein
VNSEKKNIDLLFNKGLKNFRENPPAYAWKKLEHDLDKEKTGVFWYYFRWIAASIVILIAFGSGYYIAILKNHQPEYVLQEKPDGNSVIKETSKQKPDQVAPVSNHFKKANLDNSSDQIIENNIDEMSLKRKLDNPDQRSFTDHQILANQKIASNVVINILDRQTREVLNPIRIIDFLFVEIPYEKQHRIEVSYNLHLKNNFQSSPGEPKLKYYTYEDQKPNKLKWFIGAQFAPVYSYRDISINYEHNTQGNTQELKSKYDDSEDALLAYSGGVDINYNLNKRWLLQSGLFYSKIGQINNNALNFVQDNNQFLLYSINTSTGNINVAFEKIPEDIRKINPPKDTIESIDLNNVRIVQYFNLLEIPLIIKYNLLSRKFGLMLCGGISPSYVLKNSTYLQVDHDKYNIGNSKNLNSFIYNSTVGLGINYSVSKSFSFSIEPLFKYSLSPINKDSEFDCHPYSFSFYTGLKYKF